MNRFNPRFTVEDHQQLGAELKEIRDRLQQISIKIGNTHPKTSGVTSRGLRAVNAVDSLRALLDGEFASEHPDDFNTKTYYPGAGSS